VKIKCSNNLLDYMERGCCDFLLLSIALIAISFTGITVVIVFKNIFI